MMNNNDPSDKPYENKSSQNEISTESPSYRLQQEIKKTKIKTLSSIAAIGMLRILLQIFPIQQLLNIPAVIIFILFALGSFFVADKITKRISKYISHVYYQICILLILLSLMTYSMPSDWKMMANIGLAIWILMTMIYGLLEYSIYNQKIKAIKNEETI